MNFIEFKRFFLGDLNKRTNDEWLKAVRIEKFEDFMYHLDSQDSPLWSHIRWGSIKNVCSLPLEVIKKIHCFLDYISVPECFLIKCKKIVPWNTIVYRRLFSEELLRECIDYIDPLDILEAQKISNEFVDEVINYLMKKEKMINIEGRVSYSISSNEWFDEMYLIDNVNFIDWWTVSQRGKLSRSFLRRFENKLYWDLVSLFREDFTIDELQEFSKSVNWNFFSEREEISGEILVEFEDRLNFEKIFFNDIEVPIDLIDKKSSIFDTSTWSQISYNQVLNYDFIIKHLEKLCIKTIVLENELTMANLDKTEREYLLSLVELQSKFV